MSFEVLGVSYRLAVAPRFAVEPGWATRVLRNGGLEREAGHATPRDDWKPLDPDSLARLVDDLATPDAVLPPTHLGLVQLPERMRLAFWAHAEKSGTLGSAPGLEKLFAEIAEFFRWKRLPLPDPIRLEVVVSVPGLPSTRAAAQPGGGGLGFGGATPASDAHAPTVALVNLGDEPTDVVLVEHPPATLVARLEAVGEADAASLSPERLAERYLATFPQQPCLRVRLAPGEGLWMSPFGVLHDGWTVGKRDLDVMLCVGAGDAGERPGAGASDPG